MPKLQYITDQEIDSLHQASVKILTETGIRTTSQRFMESVSNCGLKVIKNEDEAHATIYFSEEQINQALSTAPSHFNMYGLDENNQIKWGERRAYNCTSSSMPFVEDIDTHECREPLIEDLEDYVRIADALPYIDIICPLTVNGIPGHAANAIQVGTMLKNTGKPLRIVVASGKEACDVISVLSAAAGGLNQLQQKPLAFLEINLISPLDYSNGPAEALLETVEAGLPLGISPNPMQGATGPMTLVGSVTLANAETLAGVVIAQLIKPGHPTIMSPRVNPLDMSTALSNYSAPELGIAGAVATQLINDKYGIPVTASGFGCTAKTADTQAGYEVMFNSLLPGLVGVDVLGSTGSLDTVLIASYPKMVIDNEVCSLTRRAIAGCVVNENIMAVEVIHEVVNGERNFLDSDHTIEHMRSELWNPMITDHASYLTWSETSMSLLEVASIKAKSILKSHEVFPLTEDRINAVDEAVEKVINSQ